MDYLNPILGHFINPSGLGSYKICTWTQTREEGGPVPLTCDGPGFSHVSGGRRELSLAFQACLQKAGPARTDHNPLAHGHTFIV